MTCFSSALARIPLDRRLHWRVLLPPLGAGLALTALLGTGGQRTDVGAHLAGFGSGLLIGGIAGWLVARYGIPGKRLNRLLAAVAICCIIAAWLRALAAG